MNQPKVSRVSIHKAVESLLELGARQAVVYQHPNLTVKATLHNKPDKRAKSATVILTIGKPAYREREFIKAAIEAGELFPIKHVQLRWYPKKKK